MTNEELQTIKARHAATTQGAWYTLINRSWRGEPEQAFAVAIDGPEESDPLMEVSDYHPGINTPATAADIVFAAHAHADIPLLIAEIERLRALASAAQVELDEIHALISDTEI